MELAYIIFYFDKENLNPRLCSAQKNTFYNHNISEIIIKQSFCNKEINRKITY